MSVAGSAQLVWPRVARETRAFAYMDEPLAPRRTKRRYGKEPKAALFGEGAVRK